MSELVVKDALLHTRDACCTLCCGRTAKPLFHEVETVGLWVWFPSMICLGWWAGTTGPPRTPTNQGCEHPSVMSFSELQCTTKITYLLKNYANFIGFHLVFGSGFLDKKGESKCYTDFGWRLFNLSFGKCYVIAFIRFTVYFLKMMNDFSKEDL